MLLFGHPEMVKAATARREEEVQHLLMERTVRKADGNRQAKTWRWRVEPGMEEDFELFRGWFLSGLGGAHVTTPATRTAVPEKQQVPPRSTHVPTGRGRRGGVRRPSLARSGARMAGRTLVTAGRRLVQWGGEPAAAETCRV